MQGMDIAKRSPTIPLVAAALLCAALAVTIESQLRLPIRLPGHRAFPGALALVLIAAVAPRAALIGFGCLVGVLVALLGQNSLLAVVWAAPTLLLGLGQPASARASTTVAVAAGVAFGLLRYLALPAALHVTPDALRLGGHLVFGALGAVTATWGVNRSTRLRC